MRAYESSDASAVLAINEECVPEVGEMDADKLNYFEANSQFFAVEENEEGELLGFVIGLDETTDSYTSNNYAWFKERYPKFAYVDRIALTQSARGNGLGASFYNAFEAWAIGHGKIYLTAEVNTVPDNPHSHHFHAKHGFVETGRGKPYGGDEEVAYYEKTL